VEQGLTTIDVDSFSLEQKAALITGGGFWSTCVIPEYNVGELVLTDGPHGVRRQIQGTDHLGIYNSEPATCFPLAVAIGSSWNEDVASAIGGALASESRTYGVSVLLGPGINIKRSPLAGRNFEYFAEDPLLSAALATAYVRALQAGGVGASLKHYAANDQETDRMIISSDVDERTLREIHLAPFEQVVKNAAPATIMCAYNKVNGTHAAENHWLLTEVLRGDWGYEGVVVSDWGAVRNRVLSLAAGLDLAMPGVGGSAERVLKAVADGEVSEAQLTEAARRVVQLQAYSRKDEEIPFDSELHHRLAQQLATECAVLLKNANGVLPLDAGAKVLVVGEFAVEPRFQGGGSSHVNPTRVDVPLEALTAKVESYGGTVHFSADPSEAVAAAKDCDVAVIYAGLAESEESEGFDRTRLELPNDQIELIRAVAATATRTVVVLANGGVVSLEGWHDEVDSILEGFLLGQGGGDAIAALLVGDANPSGHLAETIPLRLADVPSYLHFPGEQGHVRYGEGVMVGYRHYETVGVPVRYPFGHGLSYTSFDSNDLVANATGPDAANVSVTVTNSGQRAGKHVVQLYVATDAGPVRRPHRELRAFRKIELAPGESTRVELALDRAAFAYWDIEERDWVVAGGRYAIQIGVDASHIVAEAFIDLAGDSLEKTLTLQATVGEWLAHPKAGGALMTRLSEVMAKHGQSAENDLDTMRLIETIPMNQILALSSGEMDEAWVLSLLDH
jgi:beta-glucosidase